MKQRMTSSAHLSILIFVIVAVFFRVSLQLCTFHWTETAGSHALGFSEIGVRGSITENECLNECQARSYCRAVDYNTNDRSCFYGNVSNAITRSYNDINHWELIRNCTTPSETQTNSSTTTQSTLWPTSTTNSPLPGSIEECQTSYIQYDNRVSLNGVLINWVRSSIECINTCLNTNLCAGVDMKVFSNTIECWLHFDAEDFKKVYAAENHVQIILRRCPLEDTYQCEAAYTQTGENSYSPGAYEFRADATTRDMCKYACQDAAPTCRGFDFYSDGRCMLHGDDTLEKNILSLPGVRQYRLDRACNGVCFPKWKTFTNAMGSGAILVNPNIPGGSLSACLKYCLRNSNCIGIEYTEIKGSAPVCSYYDSAQRSGMEARVAKAWTTQYELVNRCQKRCNAEFKFQEFALIWLVNATHELNASGCETKCRLDVSCKAYMYQYSGSGIRNCSFAKSYIVGSTRVDINFYSWILQYVNCSNASEQPTLPPTPLSVPPITSSSTTTGPCARDWIKFEGKHVLGLKQLGSNGQYKEEECKAECEKLSLGPTGCNLTDYNTQDKSCFLGVKYVQPSDLRDGAVINHWELQAYCKSAPSGQSSTTSLSSTTQSTTTVSTRSSSLSSTTATTSTTSSTSKAPSSSSTTPGCTLWSRVQGKNSPGLQQYGAANDYSEEECKRTCELYLTCSIIDYNTRDYTCFHGSDPTHFTANNSAVNHWIIMQRCPGQCNVTVSISAGMMQPGLQQYGVKGQYTELKCRDACAADRLCYSCDFNRQDLTCFLGYQRNPSIALNSAVNHYDFNRANC